MYKPLIITSLSSIILLISAQLVILGIIFSNLIFLSLPLIVSLTLATLILAAIIKRRLLFFVNIASLLFQIFLIQPLLTFGSSSPSYKDGLSITSFNASFVKLPRVYSKAYWSNELSAEARNIESYFGEINSDVICVQEFFDDSLNSSYSYLKEFSERGYDHMFLRNPKHDNGVSRGLVTFSKYPIIDKGKVFLSDNRYNGMSFIDIQLPEDTLRVVNVHLESMELYFGDKPFFQKIKYALSEWKRTTFARYHQINALNSFISKSPQKLVLAGDFNELPFSYNLNRLTNSLKNTFAETYTGLGRTLNKSRVPVRIDHQYYSSGITPTKSLIRKDVTGSDHHPIVCYYSLN